ncbi:hypothetical protein M404DRAFT_541402 [Pisolithus tinctorius Marx 270]|uniref:Uncharacterized protein n=1 Tax=Pisolithus tinctorius Marx 270 TaxID=870435 RepID=A0A0C3PAD1_PISTI|nr:hypothetical protein M404DRAFT_541402 [Pisolithus tinctorius Marx 270]
MLDMRMCVSKKTRKCDYGTVKRRDQEVKLAKPSLKIAKTEQENCKNEAEDSRRGARLRQKPLAVGSSCRKIDLRG